MRGKKGRILKAQETYLGYFQVRLYREHSEWFERSVHALVADAFVGKRPKGPGRIDIDHLDGDRKNNCATNLEYVTHRENMRRAGARGTLSHFRADGNAKRKILAILRDLRSGKTQTQVARKRNVSQAKVSKIVLGQNYAWLTGLPERWPRKRLPLPRPNSSTEAA